MVAKIRTIQKGKSICLISHGILIKMSFNISNTLKKQKIIPSIYSSHTLKPLDSAFICKSYKTIISIEDHLK